MSTEITDALDMVPVEEAEPTIDAHFEVVQDSDYEFARSKIRSVITTTTEAVGEIATLAQKSQDPEAYNSLSKVLKEFVKANRELMEIMKIDKDVKPTIGQDSIGTINNNLFVGSTKDLGEFITQMKKDGKISV